MRKNATSEFRLAASRGLSGSRLCVLLTTLVLQGCAATLEYLEPKPIDFESLRNPPFYSDDCIRPHNYIAVPLAAGASMEILAERGTFTKGRYSEVPGTTLFGQVFVPAGSEVRFVTATFTVHDGAGQEQSGAITEITRTIHYGPTKSTAGSSSTTQTLSSGDPLLGWTASDIRSSAVIPPTSFLRPNSDLQNFFFFIVPMEKFVAPEFTVRMPDMVVNGQPVSSKSISFKRVQKKVYGNPLCS